MRLGRPGRRCGGAGAVTVSGGDRPRSPRGGQRRQKTAVFARGSRPPARSPRATGDRGLSGVSNVARSGPCRLRMGAVMMRAVRDKVGFGRAVAVRGRKRGGCVRPRLPCMGLRRALLPGGDMAEPCPAGTAFNQLFADWARLSGCRWARSAAWRAGRRPSSRGGGARRWWWRLWKRGDSRRPGPGCPGGQASGQAVDPRGPPTGTERGLQEGPQCTEQHGISLASLSSVESGGGAEGGGVVSHPGRGWLRVARGGLPGRHDHGLLIPVC
jgi:hypothetical protein